MCYGFKKFEFDYAPPTPKFRVSDTPPGDTNCHKPQGFECVYGFRYVIKTRSRQPEGERWAVRQSTVYQKYDPVDDQHVWVLIGLSDESESCIENYLESRQQPGCIPYDRVSQGLATHVTLVENSMVDWRWYLADLSEKVRTHADKVMLADVGDIDTTSEMLKVDFGDSQRLKLLEDAILNLQTVLEGTLGTVSKLRNCLCTYAKQSGLRSATDIEISLTDLQEEASLHLAKAKVLLERVKGAASLLSDLLSYENGTALKEIAEESRKDNEQMRDLTYKATKDSEAIKVITIITVFFLPATVVAVSLPRILKYGRGLIPRRASSPPSLCKSPPMASTSRRRLGSISLSLSHSHLLRV